MDIDFRAMTSNLEELGLYDITRGIRMIGDHLLLVTDLEISDLKRNRLFWSYPKIDDIHNSVARCHCLDVVDVLYQLKLTTGDGYLCDHKGSPVKSLYLVLTTSPRRNKTIIDSYLKSTVERLNEIRDAGEDYPELQSITKEIEIVNTNPLDKLLLSDIDSDLF